MVSNGRRPTRGRDAVRADIVEAASQLFADRGPDHVSLREVAAKADVNIGLIHHYIGNKGDLITAVLEQLAARRFDDVDDVGLARTIAGYITMPARMGTERTQTMIQIRTILAGIDLRDHQSRFPVMEEIYSRLSTRTTAADARVRTAFLVSALSGWLLLGPVAVEALGGADLDDEMIEGLVTQIVDQVMLNHDD